MKKTLFTCLFALLFCAQANAQSNNLTLLYESPEGTRPAQLVCSGCVGASDLAFGAVTRSDADGNGTPDLILHREDEQGHLMGILVIDAQTQQVIWDVPDVHETLGMSDIYPVSFFGFADPFGSGVPHALFHNEQDLRFFSPNNTELIVKWSWRETQSGGSVHLISVGDVTGDDIGDIILFLSDTRQVQVWSKP